MSNLELLNKVLLQWFFVRVAIHLSKDKEGKYTVPCAYSIMYWIIPFSGWKNNYKIIGYKIKYKMFYKIK